VSVVCVCVSECGVCVSECGVCVCVSECDREASIMRGSWPTRGCRPGGGDTRNQVLIPHKRSETMVTFILIIKELAKKNYVKGF